MHISNQLIDSFPLTHSRKSCDKEKLSIALELHHKRAGLPTLSSRCQVEQAVFASKFIHQIKSPGHLLDTLSHWTMDKPTRCASLHQADKIRLPRAKKAVLQRSPLYISLSSWNALSSDLKASDSPSTLQSSLNSDL